MVRGFTPILSVAVVVALALAAVFGAMSLANPAQAHDPHTVEVYTAHERVEVDLATHLTGTFTAYAVETVPGGGSLDTINGVVGFYSGEGSKRHC